MAKGKVTATEMVNNMREEMRVMAEEFKTNTSQHLEDMEKLLNEYKSRSETLYREDKEMLVKENEELDELIKMLEKEVERRQEDESNKKRKSSPTRH